MQSIELEIFKHLFASVAEEMGEHLMRSAYSPNIKERRDFSCALFDVSGGMVAQAAHIPVHLGSAPLSVQAILRRFPPAQMSPTDRFIVNDPFEGGTHLPDITLVAPVFLDPQKPPVFFVANRAHHADVGGKTPGSMPLSQHISEEGVRIPPARLTESLVQDFLSQVRTPEERKGDLYAQLAALQTGIARLQQMAEQYGTEQLVRQSRALQEYTARIVRETIQRIPDGVYTFTDYLDDDGMGTTDIPIRCRLTIEGGEAIVDFTESSVQVKGPMNAVRAITCSAVNYVFRCLAPSDMPSNSGVMYPIRVITRPGTVVDALPPAAVAAGNVETSQRIVDVVLGALAQALPDQIPAASCGSMNNLTIGGVSPRGEPFAYYETIAGGAGAGPHREGASAIHTHMTNTRNTPVEALEHAYPLQVVRYALREGSGGAGYHRGGMGVVRAYTFDVPVTVTLLTERRRYAPYGLQGGKSACVGVNKVILPSGKSKQLPAKAILELEPGAILEIHTPGGGGWGFPED